MNDNDIVKALECCRMPVGSGSCNNCPLNHIRQKRCVDSKSCTTILFDFTLDLINRQKAEIERLKAENSELRLKMSYMKEPNTIGDIHEMGAW